MARVHGRITKDDIRGAGLRRWDGRQRITTDWFNLFEESELAFADGDVLVYLKEPGRSIRGPAFRVHATKLESRGFQALLDRCIIRPNAHRTPKCATNGCTGCEQHSVPRELYIPAPLATIEEVFDHHITTRNFFAWLYDLPLAGRALGYSLVTLKDRLDVYRPQELVENKLDVLAFAESQGYLDFRECVDHALAILYLSEELQVERLWIDAFAHCVGMKHRGLKDSIEFEYLSPEAQALINTSRLDLDTKLRKVSQSVGHFFEYDLAGNFFGLPGPAREHLDDFRSFLHTFYIREHGFWPPAHFENEQVQKDLFTEMYFDFRTLYHHLADSNAPLDPADSDVKLSGGVCVRQNIQQFDVKNNYEPLPSPMPMLPVVNTGELGHSRSQRRQSWNIKVKRKQDRDAQNARNAQALVESTNRDWSLMNCLLVRQYSEFELTTATGFDEEISLSDARKVRWILVYAILQTLISVVQAPKEVRNTDGLTYSLCCRAPSRMPWEIPFPERHPGRRHMAIEPDVYYSHTSGSTTSIGRSSSQLSLLKERRRTWGSSVPTVQSFTENRQSLRRLLPKRADSHPYNDIQKRSSYCEIFVQGYGNGLNDLPVESAPVSTEKVEAKKRSPKTEQQPSTIRVSKTEAILEKRSSKIEQRPAATPPSLSSNTITRQSSAQIKTENKIYRASEPEADIDPPIPLLHSSPSMSRESSTASNSSWSRGSSTSDTDISTPRSRSNSQSLIDALGAAKLDEHHRHPDVRVLDENHEMGMVHFNTQTWDDFLTRL